MCHRYYWSPDQVLHLHRVSHRPVRSLPAMGSRLMIAIIGHTPTNGIAYGNGNGSRWRIPSKKVVAHDGAGHFLPRIAGTGSGYTELHGVPKQSGVPAPLIVLAATGTTTRFKVVS